MVGEAREPDDPLAFMRRCAPMRRSTSGATPILRVRYCIRSMMRRIESANRDIVGRARMVSEIESHQEELRALCRRFQVRRLDLFGSAARGGFDPEHSDIDFIVEFHRGAPQHPFDAYFGLKEELEALFGRKVDLVELSAVRNPYLRASIEQSRENAYAPCRPP